MAVSFDEDHNSPRGSQRDGVRQVIRTGTTDWADIDQFAVELMPISSGGAGGQNAGAALPGNSQLRVVEFSFEPYGNTQITGQTAAGINTYSKAQWTITYERPAYSKDDAEATADGDPVPFLSHIWSGGGEFLTLPHDNLVWFDDGGQVNEDANAGIWVTTIEHQVTWHRVSNPPFSDIRNTLGKVNSAQVDFQTGPIAAETLLFLQPQIRREVMSSGNRAWEVNYRFSERRVVAQDQTAPGGWNHFFRNDGSMGGFYRIQSATPGTSLDIYEKTDFSVLFPR